MDEAKALSKPPDDSQGTNTTIYARHHACSFYIFVVQLIFLLDSVLPYVQDVMFVRDASPKKKITECVSCFRPDDESDSDAEEEQEKTVSLRPGFTPNTHAHTRATIPRVLAVTHYGLVAIVYCFLHPDECELVHSGSIFTRNG